MNDTKNKINSGRKRLDNRAYEVAARIRQMREKNGLTLAQVAKSLNVNIPCYTAWEKQFGTASERKHLYKLVDFYRVSEEWFSYGIANESDPNFKISRDFSANKLSFISREKLAERAKIRRIEIGISANDLAILIGTKLSKVHVWESVIPLTLSDPIAKLWEQSIYVPEGWLRDINIKTPVYDPSVLNNINLTSNIPSTISEEIRTIGCWLSISKINKRTSDIKLLNDLQKRTVDIFSERYGVKGEANSILQIIGDKYGITRERVRQITEKMVNQTFNLKVDTPCIDQLISDINNHLPDTIQALDDRYRNLLGEDLSIVSVDRFSREVLGKKILAFTDNPADMASSWSLIAISADSHDPEIFKMIREASHRMIRACGAANIYYVLGDAIKCLGRGISMEDTIKACRLIPGFEWLLEDDGWYWFGYNVPLENKVFVTTRKILSVAGRKVDVEDLLHGLIRNRREKYGDAILTRVPCIEPPMSALIAIFKRTPWLKTVQSDDFISLETILPEDCLSGAELKVYEFLKTNKGVASRHSITKELVTKEGMNIITLALVLDSSPIIARLDTGIFALRGRQINHAALQNALNTVWGQGAYDVSIEPDIDGLITYETVITQYSIDTRMFSVPNVFGRYFNDGDEFTVKGFDSPVTFKKYENGTCRLNNLLNKIIDMKIKINDSIQLKINKSRKEINITKVAESD